MLSLTKNKIKIAQAHPHATMIDYGMSFIRDRRMDLTVVEVVNFS